ncbi:hypothetical protein ES332_D13G032300v1 [Gossypium tomentosum]|uniref:Uncharacterized protein n=1 Tax=Gossypium tomentosum TaxID=34277 RepID=A0A5D2HS20_GOSTO|nr:hypothetical protein ES332_D13G032300v1 [Gossypium tomentosum]
MGFLLTDLRHTGASSRVSSLDVGSTLFRVDCPHFYGSNFRRWWSKFEKYFEYEGVGDHARVPSGDVAFGREGIGLASLLCPEAGRVTSSNLGSICQWPE